MEHRFIRRVIIKKMHGQFDVDVPLEPGLNVLYGKNGRGKTTLLHVIANALEQDFYRFRFLTFQIIRIEMNSGAYLEIVKDGPDNEIAVYLNGSRTSFGDKGGMSAAENKIMAAEFGGLATYLPAFRSVLERTRNRGRPVNDQPESDVDALINLEMRRLTRSETGLYPYEAREQATNTALKTTTCRAWFGKFVPIVRYPSVADVEEGLSEEWSAAQGQINQSEQRMFENTFLKIFRSIAGWDSVTVRRPASEIMTSIQQAITAEEGSMDPSPRGAVFEELVNELQSQSLELEGNNALLEIYNDALQMRNSLRV